MARLVITAIKQYVIKNDQKFPTIISGRGIKLKIIQISDETKYRGSLILINWDRGSQFMIKNEITKAKPKRDKKDKTNANPKMVEKSIN
ncbi:MAG: hypothetical protein ACFFC3_03960 [Candidatus Odinarchaeota archaeon]